jgi:hypothetical protein
MLKIGNERLFTETEILEAIRKTKVDVSSGDNDMVVWTLAIALDEDIEFIEGALRRN